MPVITRSQSRKLLANEKTQPIDEKSYEYVKTMNQPLPAKELVPNPFRTTERIVSGWILLDDTPIQIEIPAGAKTDLDRRVRHRDLAEYHTDKYYIKLCRYDGDILKNGTFYLSLEAAESQLAKREYGLSGTIGKYSIYNPFVDNGEYKITDADGNIKQIVTYKNGILRGYYDFQSVPHQKTTVDYVAYQQLICYKVVRNAETDYIISIATENQGFIDNLDPDFRERILNELNMKRCISKIMSTQTRQMNNSNKVYAI